MGRLDGRVVVVTGAASGQGEAEARLFAEEGAKVVCADVTDGRGGEVADEINAAMGPASGAGEAVFQHLDITSVEEWDALVTATEERFGPISGLVNSAAINSRNGGPVAIDEVSLDEFRQVMEVNVTSQFIGIRAVLPSMRRAGGGSIVNVSSTGGFRAVWGLGSYVTSKFAVRGLTKAFAIELGQYNVRVNSLHPGGVDTPIHAESGRSPEFMETLNRARAIGRVGTPREIALLALYLISDESSYSTGAEFLADGGMLAGNPQRY